MRTHPIIFSTAMVEAILDGRKTQTRRPVEPQPPEGTWLDQLAQDPRKWIAIDMKTGSIHDGTRPYTCPYGTTGDHLWVREKFAIECPYGPEKECDHEHHVIYWAGEHPVVRDSVIAPWHPSIHMPRRACRLELPVLSIRVERVQDITEADAYAEGCPRGPTAPHPREWFRRTWESIYAMSGYLWTSNPPVWVSEFPRQEFL